MRIENITSAKTVRAFAEKELGITDEDMLNAIRYHTTGRKNATIYASSGESGDNRFGRNDRR